MKAAQPAMEFQLCGDIKLLVEAKDQAAAQGLFGAIVARAEWATSTLVQLSPGLLFAQAQASGRYWTFELTSKARCE